MRGSGQQGAAGGQEGGAWHGHHLQRGRTRLGSVMMAKITCTHVMMR